MVLLHLLRELSARRGWKIVIAHFNHRLRGRAGDGDEALVRRTAAAMKLPVVVERADVAGFAAASKLSVEMAARKLRHQFLARAAARCGSRAIIVAHHADDQVELFFLRLLRGAGGEGLGGMKWRSPSPADPRLSLVRPLLDLGKPDLRQFAGERKIAFRDDATNLRSDYLRNRIRNRLLPLLLKEYQPGLARTVLRLMEIIGAEAEFVGAAARAYRRRLPPRRPDRAVKRSRPDVSVADSPAFDHLPAAVQRRVLQMGLVDAGITPDFDLIEQLRRAPDAVVSVSLGIFASRDRQGGVALRSRPAPAFDHPEMSLDAGGAGRAAFDGKIFNWRIAPPRLQRAAARSKQEFFDADRIGNKITLRHWRPGDRFRPIGLNSAAKLQDLFVNAKVPREQRRRLVLAEASDGEIFWVEGLRIGENFKLRAGTKRRLIWKWAAQ